MIKPGKVVSVYEDPLTCKKVEFVGTVTKVLFKYADNQAYYCEVEDCRGDKYNRKINIKKH